jgi:hypothetical protein
MKYGDQHYTNSPFLATTYIMPEKVEGVENTSLLDSLLILQGEKNYAPWLHFLIGYLGPEYWKILRGDERRPSQPHKVDNLVDPELANPSEKTPPPPSRTQGLDGVESPDAQPAQRYDGEDDKCCKALSYLRATLNEDAMNLIRDIDSPSEAFNKIKLFYGKPRHQTMALRWSKWAGLRYTPGDSPSEFVHSFGERLRELEEIGDILDHKTVFAQFVHAISEDGNYPDFILQMSPDLEDRNLMEAICDAFIRHESSFTYAAPIPVPAIPKPAHRAKSIKRENNGFEYCPFHNRIVRHSPAECRLGQKMKPQARLDVTQMFGGSLNRNNKRRRLNSCDIVPTGYFFLGS